MSETSAGSTLSVVDVLCLCLYFVLLFFIAYRVSRMQTTSQSSPSDAYFLAEKQVPWWAVSASLFASNIGTEHFIGLAGSAARDGIAVGWFEIGAIPAVLFLGFFFLPMYMKAEIQTTPDYLAKRYNTKCRTFVVCHALIIYIFTKVSVTLYAGQLILVELTEVNKNLAVLVLVVGTAAYTVVGGLGAVVYTEALQTIVLILGGLLVFIFSLEEAGGMDELRDHFVHTKPNFFHMFRPVDDDNYPWTGFIFGYYCSSLWYWGIDQVIAQRAMAARDLLEGQIGATGAACLKMLPFLLMVLPGVCARLILDKSGEAVEYDRAYPFLVRTVVPLNLRGIIVASMLASLMSSLASAFNSSSTLFTLNIYKTYHPNTSERGLVWIGRATVVVLALLSFMWVPMIPLLGNSLFIVVQKPATFTAGPILAVFLGGMLSRTPTPKGAFTCLCFGMSFGLFRFILEVINVFTPIATSEAGIFNIFAFILNINFLNFGAVNFVLSCIVLFVTSVSRRDFKSESELDELIFTIGVSKQVLHKQRSQSTEPEIEFTTIQRQTSNEGFTELALHNTTQYNSDALVDVPILNHSSAANTTNNNGLNRTRSSSLDNDWSDIELSSHTSTNTTLTAHNIRASKVCCTHQRALVGAVFVLLGVWVLAVFALR